MPKSKKIYFMLLILLFCVGCDQISKNIARSSLASSPPITFWGELVRLQYAENTGAFLSLGSGLSKNARTLLFTLLSGVLLVGLFFYVLFSRDLDKKHIFALALILGGGSSNLLDRVIHDGRVIDFMNMGIGSLRTGIFNFADVVIMGGMGLVIFLNIRHHRKQSKNTKEDIDTQHPDNSSTE
ncbi:MAG: signal peptidase II [Planctomycetes bacterium]|nr:signal peptidase II [Planctomycetota bacterium]